MSFSSHQHEIVPVPFGREGEGLRQQCYNVRINVFHHEQGFPLEAEIDKLRLILAPPPSPFSGQGVKNDTVAGLLCLFPRLRTQTRRDG